jgi:hypothetical protein
MKAGLWVAAAAATALAAGTSLGFAVCHARAASRDDAELLGADREFLQRFAREFELRAEQVALLGAILRRRAQDETAIYRRNIQNLPEAVRDEITGARRAADKRIEFMLDPPQRARYEQMLEKR